MTNIQIMSRDMMKLQLSQHTICVLFHMGVTLRCLDQRKQSYRPNKLENFLLRYMEDGLVGILLPTNIAVAI